jgi:hypothetical protein
MLATLPKLADKAFVLGFLFPVLFFLISGFLLFSDIKAVSDLLHKFAEKDALEKFAYVVLLVWGLAVLMMMLNHILYRMLEGYLWPLSELKWLKTRQLGKFDKLSERVSNLAEEWRSAGDAFTSTKRREHDLLLIDLVRTFPAERESVLPTRFGNAIRAFEVYSKEVYGADSVPLWLHLATVVPKEFQAALEDARAQVNCLVNLCFFALLIGLMAAVRFVQSPDWMDAVSIYPPSIDIGKLLATQGFAFGSTIIGAAVVVRVAYELSVERVHSWGIFVKAAFDCYLPALASRLGYRLPTTREAQQNFWTAVSRRAIYHRQLNPEEWPRADKNHEDEDRVDGQNEDGEK